MNDVWPTNFSQSQTVDKKLEELTTDFTKASADCKYLDFRNGVGAMWHYT